MSAKITGVYTAEADDKIPGVDMVTAEADDEIPGVDMVTAEADDKIPGVDMGQEQGVDVNLNFAPANEGSTK